MGTEVTLQGHEKEAKMYFYRCNAILLLDYYFTENGTVCVSMTAWRISNIVMMLIRKISPAYAIYYLSPSDE